MIKWLTKKQWIGEKQCCELKGVMAEEMVSESYNKIFCDKAKMYIQCIASDTVIDGSLFKSLQMHLNQRTPHQGPVL